MSLLGNLTCSEKFSIFPFLANREIFFHLLWKRGCSDKIFFHLLWKRGCSDKISSTCENVAVLIKFHLLWKLKEGCSDEIFYLLLWNVGAPVNLTCSGKIDIFGFLGKRTCSEVISPSCQFELFWEWNILPGKIELLSEQLLPENLYLFVCKLYYLGNFFVYLGKWPVLVINVSKY